ncbi:MAG TPA: type IV pilus modification protein PilV [Burkholderiaceae bacterium]|nr:type IV pilus modification protein PilV [Burkholderiaceae bacterium]
MNRAQRRGARQHGVTLIEVLVSLIVFAFGMLALGKLQVRTALAEAEAMQRAQAMALVHDLVDRMNLYRANAADYVQADEIDGSGEAEDCSTKAAGAPRDVCEWTNLLRGITVKEGEGGPSVGSVIGGRACIRQLVDGTGTAVDRSYVITVAWQGLVPTAAPDNTCGKDQFDVEARRRTYSFTLQIGNLSPL